MAMATTTTLPTDAPRPETAVVTGAAGWLGQNLVRALAPQRERVRCLVHDAEDAPIVELAGPSVDVVVGDVRDPAVLDRLFDGVGAATVFHAAGVIHPASIREFFDVNVGGTQLTLDRARRAGIARFVHVSSNSPFGANATNGDAFDQSSSPNPYMGYGRSKLEAEQLVTRAHERGDLVTTIVRPPWFYGPFQPERQTMWFRALRRGRFPLVGDGTQRRSMVFTGNLVEGVLRAEVAGAAPGRAWWIADAEPYQLRGVLATVRRALGAEGLDVTGGQPRVPRAAGALAATVDGFVQARGRYLSAVHVLGELKDSIVCNIAESCDELGYKPATDLFDGMRASIRWCLDRGHTL
jgi:nucleoside-diphosphate-sugar epimerase